MSQRARILLTVAVIVLPLVVLDGVRMGRNYAQEKAAAQSDRIRIVESAALSVQVFIENNVAALQALALYPELARGAPTAELRSYLQGLVQHKPDWVGLGVIGPDGMTLAGTSGTASIYLGDRPYFRQAVATGQAAVSAGIVGRVTGKTNVVIAVPFALKAGGQGVLLAPLPIEAFTTQLLPILRPQSAEIAVVDGAGQLIAHSEGGRVKGLISMRDAPGVTAALRGETGALSAADDLVAHAPVKRFGWALVSREPGASAFAAARRTLVEQLMMLLGMLSVVAALSWYLSGRLARAYEREVAARAALERSLRTRDDFLAAASHDLRNPLAAVRSACDLLQVTLRRGGAIAAERLEGCLAHIDSGTRRMAALIDAFLDVTRLQTGAPLDLSFGEVDAARMLREVAEEARLLNPHHRILLDAPEGLVMRADGERLRRAIANVVGNAAKYSPRGGDVSLRLECSADGLWVIFTVADAGIGIPPGELQAIFERFRRGSNVVGRIAGTGIGLAGARQIAEQHGGSIEVRSELGKGTTVVVSLPCAASAHAHFIARKEAA